MTPQGWTAILLVALAAIFLVRKTLRGFSSQSPGSCCGGCSGSCGEKPVNIRPEDERKV